MLVEFKEFMEKDRGLSPATVEHRCNSIRPFLDRSPEIIFAIADELLT